MHSSSNTAFYLNSFKENKTKTTNECKTFVVLMITSGIGITSYALHTLCLTADSCRLKLYVLL